MSWNLVSAPNRTGWWWSNRGAGWFIVHILFFDDGTATVISEDGGQKLIEVQREWPDALYAGPIQEPPKIQGRLEKT